MTGRRVNSNCRIQINLITQLLSSAEQSEANGHENIHPVLHVLTVPQKELCIFPFEKIIYCCNNCTEMSILLSRIMTLMWWGLYTINGPATTPGNLACNSKTMAPLWSWGNKALKDSMRPPPYRLTTCRENQCWVRCRAAGEGRSLSVPIPGSIDWL